VQKELEGQLRELATRDELTGLFNRRQFLDLADKALSDTERDTSSLTLCMLDVDHFKAVNDQHGHAVGDRVLVQIARAAASAIRSGDVLARIGGEELAVLLPHTDVAGALHVAERVREAIAALDVEGHDGQRVRPTASLGVAAFTPGDKVEDLMRRADVALYRAKANGRNRVVAQLPEQP